MITSLLFTFILWSAIMSYMFWPTLQNFRSSAMAGHGPRHREPGLATPWHRSRPAHEYDPRFRADGTRHTTWRPVNAVSPVLQMREWTKPRTPSAIEAIRSVDLGRLHRLAGGRL